MILPKPKSKTIIYFSLLFLIFIRSKKKKKKEKLPAPFSEPAKPDDLGDLNDLDELPPELLDELKNYEPTEEEIAAEFERLKAEEDKKKKKKQKVEIKFLKFLVF